MSKIACHVIVAAGLLLSGMRLLAEDTPPPSPGASPTPAATTASIAPAAGAVLAPGKAGNTAITASLPRYAPPPAPAPKKPVADVEAEDEAEPEGTPSNPDQPRNKIIRLPRYIVEGDRPPVFRERDVFTKQALAAIAMRRYLSTFDRSFLNRFDLFGSKEGRAMAMYYEDERLQNIVDLKNDAANARKAGDKAESDYLVRETNATFLRSGGMDWNSWSK